MKSQPNGNYKSDDVVMTPEDLALKLIAHFNPSGKGLEPCRGTGNIWKNLKKWAYWEDVQQAIKFYEELKQDD